MAQRAAAAAYAALIELLWLGPCTIKEMQEATGMCESNVRKIVAALRRRKQLNNRPLLGIDDWEEDTRGARIVKVWRLGAGGDAPRPPTKKDDKPSYNARRRIQAAKRRDNFFRIDA